MYGRGSVPNLFRHTQVSLAIALSTKRQASAQYPIELGTVFMKAQIYVNRHITRANKKASKETGEIVDNKAIAVNTYKGSIYCKEVEFTKGGRLIQDAENARCSGATIWIETEFESLIIDGVEANRSMYEEPLEIDERPCGRNVRQGTREEDYFWQFVEDFKPVKDDNYLAIARYLNPKYAADKKALKVVFKELKEKLERKLYRDELELSIDDFDDLTSSIIGLGKKRYCSVLKNPRSAMYLTDSIKSVYSVLNLLS